MCFISCVSFPEMVYLMMPSAASSLFAYLSLDGADDDERNRVWVDQLCCVTERINIY